MPYEAIRNHQHVGMSADYLRFVGGIAELDFQLQKTQSWKESLDKLKSGECELISMLNRSPARDKYILFSQPFFFGPNVIVSKGSKTFLQGYESVGDRRLGAVANYRHAEYVSTHYPQINLQLFESESAGLEKLAEGEIDLFIGSMLSVNSHIQKYGLRSLKIAGWAEPQDKLSMGVGKGNYALLQKLNLAIEKIPESLHVKIYKEWNNARVIDEIDYRVYWAALAVFAAVLVGGFWRNRIIQRFSATLISKNNELEALQTELVEKNQALEFMSMRDPLTSLYNRNFMSKRCEQEQLVHARAKQPVSLVILDVDHFKPINDKFGHTVGDKVLVEIAQRIASTIREIDVASRWGGEEFLILCPQTNIVQAEALAIRLRDAFNEKSFESVGNVSCSFGVAEYKSQETFIECFDRADSQLYEAKDAGRNRIHLAS